MAEILIFATTAGSIILLFNIAVSAAGKSEQKKNSSEELFKTPEIILEDGTRLSHDHYTVLQDGTVMGDVAVWDWDKTPSLVGSQFKILGKEIGR